MSSVNLTSAVRRRRAHQARFLDIVVTLSYHESSWDFFKETLRFLSQKEIIDVLDERFSLDKCGYVPCEKTLKVHPAATVSLDIPDKKIYNISRRKKFCSDWCYAAFKYIENQLPENPIWKTEVIPQIIFKQYSKTEKGCKGEIFYEDNEDYESEAVKEAAKEVTEEIIANITPGSNKIKNPVNITNKDVVQSESNDGSNKIERIQNIIKALDTIAITKKKNLEEVLLKVKEKSAAKKDRKLIFLDESPEEKKKVQVDKTENVQNSLTKVVESLSEWVTDSTEAFLNLENNVIEHEIDNENEVVNPITEDLSQFYILPKLDSCDQVVVRRSIILRQIQACATPILAEFGIDDNSFHLRVLKFLNTCKLSSSNILFNSKDLKCLIVILIGVLFPKMSESIILEKKTLFSKYHIDNENFFKDSVAKIEKAIHDKTQEELPASVTSQGDF